MPKAVWRTAEDSTEAFLFCRVAHLAITACKECVKLFTKMAPVGSHNPPLTPPTSRHHPRSQPRPLLTVPASLSSSLEPYVVAMFTGAGRSHLLSPSLIALISTARSPGTITHYLSYHRPWLHFAATIGKPPYPSIRLTLLHSSSRRHPQTSQRHPQKAAVRRPPFLAS